MTQRMILKICVCVCLLVERGFSGEGMFPISMATRIGLTEKGLKMNPLDLFRTDSVSLAHAVVRLGGCTGSFISDEGLILTNYHCAFDGIQQASSVQNDYIRTGFLARTRSEETQIRGERALILEDVRDVSSDVLQHTSVDMPSLERLQKIAENRAALLKKATAEFPGKKVEVSEMMVGQSYYLFVYLELRDVRLVYAPPRSIGQFGGEMDNWVWPRHTGDFSMMRAYVAPDGMPADFSPQNVPYHPKRILSIEPAGVQEDDFILVMGYPGRTHRHRPASFIEFELKRMEVVGTLWEFEIALMEEAGKVDRAVAIKLLPQIEGFANNTKRWRGQRKTLHAENFIQRKRQQESELMKFIGADAERSRRYGNVLRSMDSVYAEMSRTAERDFLLDRLFSDVRMLRIANRIVLAGASEKIDTAGIFQNIRDIMSGYEDAVDRKICREILRRLSELPQGQAMAEMESLFERGNTKALDRFVEGLYKSGNMSRESYLRSLLEKPSKIASDRDPFLKLVRTFQSLRLSIQDKRKKWDAELSRLYPLLTEVRQQFLKTDFLPDANSTMRLSYGRIRGYAPADAVVYRPITTLSGLIAKTGEEPFDTPAKLIELHRARTFGRYRLAGTEDVPVAILYDSDTTGGNSGSPVVNAYGKLIGLNFDRAFEATINDFAWSDSYSRSIGVDVRYILWVMEYFSGAQHLLKEMKVGA